MPPSRKKTPKAKVEKQRPAKKAQDQAVKALLKLKRLLKSTGDPYVDPFAEELKLNFIGGKVGQPSQERHDMEGPDLTFNVSYIHKKFPKMTPARVWKIAQRSAIIASARWPTAWIDLGLPEEGLEDAPFIWAEYSACGRVGDDWDTEHHHEGPSIKLTSQEALLRQALGPNPLK